MSRIKNVSARLYFIAGKPLGPGEEMDIEENWINALKNDFATGEIVLIEENSEETNSEKKPSGRKPKGE